MSIPKEKLEQIINAAISERINHTHTEDCQYCALCNQLTEMPMYVQYLRQKLFEMMLGDYAGFNDCFLIGYFVGRSTIEIEAMESLIKKGE